ncbi:predicted protein [Sclerotinia sclerotiorum 1980 UF-70]|uniref:Uncharacterized protein n=1 Tax=Sclerotinia sclerotiorum (strain ATCC 18683 / 1980 / Ss-1) TaxID=665079 RepID=A7EVR5_SCLS1|nr:predicted protein [Sclerotinia sclerotiorum 1980 UF-70]EDN93557.1 predicted protein [Sclerotinia sclerotiorum 1980 UF-70]
MTTYFDSWTVFLGHISFEPINKDCVTLRHSCILQEQASSAVLLGEFQFSITGLRRLYRPNFGKAAEITVLICRFSSTLFPKSRKLASSP